MKIFIGENSLFLQNRLIEMLASIPEVIIVGKTTNASDTVEQIMATNPDVTIFDMNLFLNSGFSILKGAKSFTSPVVIVLTDSCLYQYKRKCRELGAKYFLNKANDFFKVPKIIRKLVKQQKIDQHI